MGVCSGSGYGWPDFTARADALMGFDESILMHCLDLQGRWREVEHQPHDREIARECIKANQNVLRLNDDRYGWNMCQNVRWMLCALTGRLHGQEGGRAIHFATRPKSIEVAPLNGYGYREGRYSVANVYYIEICLLAEFCTNTWKLFSVEDGEPFECELDRGAYERYAEWLMTSG